MRSNISHLYGDVFWWGILGGSTLAFLNVYATRLGASGLQLGLLAAGPAVASLLVSLPAGRWLESRSRSRAAFLSSVAQRLGYLAMIALPWLLPAAGQVWALELIVLAIAVPGTLLAIAFNSMLVEIIPPEERGHVVARRNALVSLSLAGSSLVCGRLLDWIAFPLNYQVVFLAGAAGAAMSTYHLYRLRPPATPPPARPAPQAAGKLLRLDLLRGSFGPFMAAYLLFYVFQMTPSPLFPLAFVRELHMTDGAISLGTALYHGAVLAASTRLGPLIQRWGHRRVLIAGALVYSIYPALIAVAHDATLYWVASALGGVTWALAGASLINRLMERVPQDDLPTHMALYNIALNLGTLSGSLLGPQLASWLGLRPALWLSAALRVLGGVLFIAWG